MNTIKPGTAAALPFYTIGEEIANSILHGIGTLAAIAGLVLLTLKTRGILGGHKGAVMDTTAVLIFSSAMTGMFLASTLYHAIQHRGAKRILRIFDHSVIYLFIAGTYTPLCLSGLKGAWGWSLFGVEWGLAIIGITLYVLGNKALKKIEVIVYILMGWAIVIGFVPLLRSVPALCVILLFAGGLLYTLGTIWYRKKHIKGTHAVWHVFVLLGTVCHWFSIYILYGSS
jgi:hemolysin III